MYFDYIMYQFFYYSYQILSLNTCIRLLSNARYHNRPQRGALHLSASRTFPLSWKQVIRQMSQRLCVGRGEEEPGLGIRCFPFQAQGHNMAD